MSLEEAYSRLRVAEAVNEVNELIEDVRVKHKLTAAEELEMINTVMNARLSIISTWARRMLTGLPKTE